MIRFLVMLLLSCNAGAATMSAVIGGGAAKTGSSWAVKGASATAANGVFTTPATVMAAGRQIQMPGAATFAANAASFALTAVRLNPAGLLVGLTAQWLLGEGLSYVNNEWQKSQSVPNTTNLRIGTLLVSNYGGSYEAAAQAACAAKHWSLAGGYTVAYPGNYLYRTCSTAAGSTAGGYIVGPADCNGFGSPINVGGFPSCGAAINTTVPATESDFNTAGTHPITDGAAQELARADVPMPVNQPVLNSASVDTYGTPYLDPVSGRMVKELIRVTPDPTADNPFNVRVEKYQVDAGAVTGQTAAPVVATKEASIGNQMESIQFPSDYARQGEAAAAAQSINDALGPKLDKITETGADPADPVEPPNSQFDQAFFQGTFTNLLGWQLPAHTSQCPTSSFNWNNTSYTLDSHCQLVANHFSAFSSVMSVVWTILALFILLGA